MMGPTSIAMKNVGHWGELSLTVVADMSCRHALLRSQREKVSLLSYPFLRNIHLAVLTVQVSFGMLVPIVGYVRVHRDERCAQSSSKLFVA